MQSRVPKGLATWAGIIAAVGQYAAAIAVFLNDTDKATALGPLTTATVTLVTVIYGRMQQARTIQAADGLYRADVSKVKAASVSYGSPSRMMQVGQASPPSQDVMRDNALDPEPPEGRNLSIADEKLDDPFYEPPTSEQHSHLRG